MKDSQKTTRSTNSGNLNFHIDLEITRTQTASVEIVASNEMEAITNALSLLQQPEFVRDCKWKIQEDEPISHYAVQFTEDETVPNPNVNPWIIGRKYDLAPCEIPIVSQLKNGVYSSLEDRRTLKLMSVDPKRTNEIVKDKSGLSNNSKRESLISILSRLKENLYNLEEQREYMLDAAEELLSNLSADNISEFVEYNQNVAFDCADMIALATELKYFGELSKVTSGAYEDTGGHQMYIKLLPPQTELSTEPFCLNTSGSSSQLSIQSG